MGRKAKIKKLRRAQKELDLIIDEGLETGRIAETEDGKLSFNDEETAESFFGLLFLHPDLMLEFIDQNPEFLPAIAEAAAQEEEEEEQEENTPSLSEF